jgi:hypothetical protein
MMFIHIGSMLLYVICLDVYMSVICCYMLYVSYMLYVCYMSVRIYIIYSHLCNHILM